MASAGATFPIDMTAGDEQHFLIVESRSDTDRADEALRGASEALDSAGASYDVVSVPSVLEIPAAIAMALEAGDYDGFIALGVVVHKPTMSVGYIVPEVTRALLELSVVDALPLGNGLVMVETEGEALGQTSVAGKNIGGGAARTVLAMSALKAKLNS